LTERHATLKRWAIVRCPFGTGPGERYSRLKTCVTTHQPRSRLLRTAF
jgi:hypothetical protein